jgi:bifunctional non-homologous end joining protein LigD
VASHPKHRNASKVRPTRRAAAAPEFVPPMRATLVDKLPVGPEWFYEVKWDGYRALAAKHGDSVRLLSLKNNNLADSFPKVVETVKTVQVGDVFARSTAPANSNVGE